MYLGSSLRTITLRVYTLESGAIQFLLHNVDHLLFQDDADIRLYAMNNVYICIVFHVH